MEDPAKAPESDTAPASATASHSAETRYAGRIGKHAAVYGSAAFMSIVSGLISIAVFTRFLDPTAFGKVAVFMTVASFVTVGVNLGSLQGTMRRVHGAAGDEDAGEDEIDKDAQSSDPRMALTTGLVLTGVVGTLLFLIAFVLREDLSKLFFGTTADSGLFLLSVGAGVSAGVMRLARNMLRLQLRSVAYLVVSTVFALGSTAVAIPLLAHGVGISAILIGAIAGSAASAVLAIGLLRHDVRAAVSLNEAKEIMRSGVAYLPIILSFQILQLADTFLVAGFADLSSAGLYGVAKKVAQPVSYGTSVFQQAWGPMARDLTYTAVDRKDDDLAITARLATYYVVFVVGLILGISIFADQLVRLASPAYQSASLLIPVTALSIAGHGAFVFAYRISKLANRWYWINILSSTAAPIFVGIAAFLIVPFGAIGAPIAAVCAWAFATAAMVFINQSQAQEVPFERLRLVQICASAAVVWAVGYYLVPDSVLGLLVKAALFAGWAALIVALGVVPMAAIRSLLSFVRYSSDAESKRNLRARVASLGGRDATLVQAVVRDGMPVEDVAEHHGLPEDEVLALTVQALRTAATGGEPKPTDAALGRAILIPRASAEEHHLLIELTGEGADPIDTDLIIRTAAAARGRRRRLRGSA